jgi:pimeloyl-ACP methyl ester carboxylesterase
MVDRGLADGTPLRAKKLQLLGLSLHVVEAGPADGPAVILLHGFPEFWWGWRRQIGPLSRAGFRVIAPDQRGYANSDKPLEIASYRLARLGTDVIELADRLALERFDLVGHDWGGIVAWWVAGRHSERVRRLAILNAPHPDTAGRVLRADPYQLFRSWYVAVFQLPVLPERLLAAGDYALLVSALKKSSRPGTFTEYDLAGYREAWRSPGALGGMLGWYRAMIRHQTRPLGQIAPPTSLIWGRRDTALGFAVAREGLAMCENGALTSFEASHWVQHEEAERVNAALLTHLTSS